jgi:glycosyltransferase 2 family protein
MSGSEASRKRIAVNVVLSLVVGAACVAFAAHGMDWPEVVRALRALAPSAIGIYVLTLAVTHLFRSWRWEYLLRALGVSLPFGRLMLISAAGFMAILALPFRLGEFVRPFYVSRERGARMSTLLGAVAVERIVDGLLISVLFFVASLVSAKGAFSAELRFAAWLSLLGFLALTAFLVAAQIWTERAIRFVLRVTLVAYLAPARAHRLADKLRALISGFRALRDGRNFSIFLLQSALYWGMNGFGMYLLAGRMQLPISVGAAYVVMAFTGVVLTLPNSPGLVGQFHAAIKAGLLAYVPAALVNTRGIAYAIVLHGVQAIWYVGLGIVAMIVLSRTGAHAKLRDAVHTATADEA